MNVEIMLRRRAALGEAVPALNAKFVEDFLALPGFWAAGKPTSVATCDPGTGESAIRYFRNALAIELHEQIVSLRVWRAISTATLLWRTTS
jgi:hypothetical protein